MGVLLQAPNFEGGRSRHATQMPGPNISKVRRMDLIRCCPPPGIFLRDALLWMGNLRSPTIHQSNRLPTFLILEPSRGQSNATIFPKLESIFLCQEEEFEVRGMISMAAARASSGAKLKLVRITSPMKAVQNVVSKLRKQVSHVSTMPFSVIFTTVRTMVMVTTER